MQRHLEHGHGRESNFPKVLELGAGSLQHHPFVRHSYETYIASDIRPIGTHAGWAEWGGGRTPDAIGNFTMTADATAIPFDDATFDRVVATCLILHIPDPAAALQEWLRVTKPGGTVDFLMPCEPGLALRLYRLLFSRRRAKKLGFEYFNLVNAVDHCNSTWAILELVEHLDGVASVRSSWRPFPFLRSWNANLQSVVRLVKTA